MKTLLLQVWFPKIIQTKEKVKKLKSLLSQMSFWHWPAFLDTIVSEVGVPQRIKTILDKFE